MILSVPWQSQLDNLSGAGRRECFSSSCAMVAMFHKKINTDDEYNEVRARFGDTTSPEAQLRTLRALGLRANFHTDGSPARLEGLIREGLPTPAGWLHRGPVAAPRGGGHWSVVIGFTAHHWVHNDPNGEALLVTGGYTSNRDGRCLYYSRRNWDRRWMPGGEGGWYVEVRD